MGQHLPGCVAAYCTPSAADVPRFSAQACELLLLLVRPHRQCPANKLTCFALSLTPPKTGILVRQGSYLRSDQVQTTEQMTHASPTLAVLGQKPKPDHMLQRDTPSAWLTSRNTAC